MSSSLLINPTALEAGLEAAMAARTSASDTQRAAFQRYAKLGMPHRRVEGWKWSDFHAAIRNTQPANDVGGEAVISPSVFAGLDPIEFRIVDGRIELPENDVVEGLEFGIIDAASTDPDFDDHSIAALNVAMTSKALGFKTEKGANITRPLLIRHINTGTAPVFSQVLAKADMESQLTVIECFEGQAPYHSAMFHIAVRDGAVFDRYVLQDTDAESVTHGFLGIMVGEGAKFHQASLSTGGRLCRHETHVLYPAKKAQSEILSAALVSGDRHTDFTTNVLHKGEACETRQLHKGVARDRGKNIFQGKFHVERSAQQTDAQMIANALLLSDMAEANHKPELEIYADDVECAHGSTSGALDDDALFYLRQRGLDEHAARTLLIEAFLGEVTDRIENDSVSSVFQARINEWLGDA